MPAFGSVTSTQDVNKNTSSNPTPGSTVSIDATLGNLFKWTAGENETVNVTAGQLAGRDITLLISNDGILARTITLGTGFVGIGAIVGTVNKTVALRFQSDGTNFYELSRTLLL